MVRRIPNNNSPSPEYVIFELFSPMKLANITPIPKLENVMLQLKNLSCRYIWHSEGTVRVKTLQCQFF